MMDEARGAMPQRVKAFTRPGTLLRRLLRSPAFLYRWCLGWLVGHRFLCLPHRGRRSGRTYRTVAEVVRFDRPRNESVVMSGVGRRSDWFRNVLAGGAIWVETGGGGYSPRWRVLDAEEGVRVLADYERRNRLIAPIVRVVFSKLVGWRYEGSESDRRALINELPLVAFWPKREADEPA